MYDGEAQIIQQYALIIIIMIDSLIVLHNKFIKAITLLISLDKLLLINKS